MISTKRGTAEIAEVFPQTDGIYDGMITYQHTSHTMDTNSENNIRTSPSTAVRTMICVITQTSIPLTITDTVIPVYQQSIPSISEYGLRNVYV